MMTPNGMRTVQVMQLVVPEESAEVNASAEAKIIDAEKSPAGDEKAQGAAPSSHEHTSHEQTGYERSREKLRQQFREGKLDERMVELDVRDRNQPSFEFMAGQGPEDMDMNIKDMLPGLFGQRTKKRKMKVAEAFEYLVQEE